MINNLFNNKKPESEAETCHRCGLQSICMGLGMVRYAVPMEDERFGKLLRCPNYPPERDEGWQGRIREISNLNTLADKTFENFKVFVDNYGVQENQSLAFASDAAQRFAEDPKGWLLLSGLYGTGKTHLAAAVGNARLRRGDEVIFTTVPDLLDHLRATYGPNSEMGYDEMFNRMRNVPLLILDDLGVENPSPWAQEKLFQLLNHRYAGRLNTVITTNADVDTLDPRIRSRLLDINLTTRVIFKVPDYRNLMGNEEVKLDSSLSYHAHMTFESFDLSNAYLYPTEQGELKPILRAAMAYAEDPEGWIVLQGNPGAGKTHLAAAIANHYQEQGGQAVFVTVASLMDYLRKTFSPGSRTSFDERFNQVKHTPLLVLDHFVYDNTTAWSQEKLFQLVDHRYLMRLPTVITTHYKVDNMEARIAARLMDDRFVQLHSLTLPGYARRRQRSNDKS